MIINDNVIFDHKDAKGAENLLFQRRNEELGCVRTPLENTRIWKRHSISVNFIVLMKEIKVVFWLTQQKVFDYEYFISILVTIFAQKYS